MNPGIVYAILAFTIWGLFPLYLKPLAGMPALMVVLHRSAWALVFLLLVLVVLRRWAWLQALWRNPRQLKVPLLCALLLSLNWLLYVYAVQGHQVLQASLGYFITPLFNVLLGVVVLRERLHRVQWAAVALAAAGVGWLTLRSGGLPWLALALAASFAVYGLIRKTAALGALEGLTLETLILAPLVLPALAWWAWTAGHEHSVGQWSWLMLGGPLTALPLMFFAAGARRLRLATLGMVQYLSPTLQLLIGVWVFGEPFGGDRLLGFVLIWAALALHTLHALTAARAAPQESLPPA